jgi:hypothetical protein
MSLARGEEATECHVAFTICHGGEEAFLKF